MLQTNSQKNLPLHEATAHMVAAPALHLSPIRIGITSLTKIRGPRTATDSKTLGTFLRSVVTLRLALCSLSSTYIAPLRWQFAFCSEFGLSVSSARYRLCDYCLLRPSDGQRNFESGATLHLLSNSYFCVRFRIRGYLPLPAFAPWHHFFHIYSTSSKSTQLSVGARRFFPTT